MATRAAWLVDRVIPEVPVRQWVLTLPWARRLVLARRQDLLLGVWREALGVIFAWYRYQAAERLGLPPERARDFCCGAVTQVQRFSSALTLVSGALYLALSPPLPWVNRTCCKSC